jgi:hypothetical protein
LGSADTLLSDIREHKTYQEQRIGQKGIEKHNPADPPTSSLATVENLSHGNGDNDADKFVARVGYQVEKLRLTRDAQEVASQLQCHNLNDDDYHARGGGISQQLWLELTLETSNQGGEEDIRDEGHDYDACQLFD